MTDRPQLIPPTTDTDDAFITAALSYLAGELDTSDVAALEAQLKASARHRKLFAALATQSRLFHELHREPTNAKPRPSVAVPHDPASPQNIPIYRKGHEPRPKSETRIPKFAIYSGVAAALLTACGVAIYVFVSSLPHSELPDPTSTAPLATLIEATDGSNLTTPGGFISEGRDYPRGEYALDKGSAEFMLTNAVNVKLRGETRMFMHHDMQSTLARGSATFICPPRARGYTVVTDAFTVIDLGTRFEVNAGSTAGSSVTVFEGAVRVRRNRADGGEFTVNAGEALWFDASGRPRPAPAVRLVGVHESTLGRMADAGLDKPLDLDGDDRYGTAGYVFWNASRKDEGAATTRTRADIDRIQKLPRFIASVTESPGTFSAHLPTYLPINLPSAPSGGETQQLESGLLVVRATATREPRSLATIHIERSEAVGVIRLGVLVDTADRTDINPASLVLRSADAEIETAVLAEPDSPDGDLYLFDLATESLGDTVELLVRHRAATGAAAISGLTFDTSTAPPQSAPQPVAP